MDERTRQLQDRLSKLVVDGRAITEKANAEDRDLNQEEQNRYDAIFTDIAAVKTRIDRENQIATEERRLREAMPTVAARDGAVDRGQPAGAKAEHPMFSRARAWLLSRGIQPDAEPSVLPVRNAFNRYLRGGINTLGEAERRDLQMDADTQGGFLVPPQEFSAALIQAVDDAVWIRQFATVETVTQAESLGIASLDADPADADWTAEVLVGGTDSSMKFGKRELRPHPLGKLIKISNKLIRASKLSIEAKVIERLTYKFGIAAEKAYLLGTGAEQPLGVFVADPNGISTARDVSTGNTTTAIQAPGLIEAKYKMKANYWPRLKWIFHRDALKGIMKLTDTNGQYLWVTAGLAQRGLAEGQPDTLLGAPTYLSEYAPNTFTTGLYVGIIGDFSKYGIVDALSLQFQRLVELFAATNQVGYIGRLESDGMPLLEEGFARVKLA